MLSSVMRAAAEKMLIDFQKTQQIAHSLTKGEAREAVVLETFLRPYLPSRYSISTGIIVDIEGKQSSQQDLVVYDQFNSPILEDFKSSKFFFPESVFASIEVKSVLTKEELTDAAKKSISVWELKRAVAPNLILAPGLTIPSSQTLPLCLGFFYTSKLSITGARDILRQIREEIPGAHSLSCVCILKDKDEKSGLVLSMDANELTRVMTVPSASSRLGILEYNSAGDALLYFYLLLIEHLRSYGAIIPGANLMAYAVAGGMGTPYINIAPEDMKGAFVTVSGKKVSTDIAENLRQLSIKLLAGEISDEELLEFYYLFPAMPSGESLLDPRSRIFVDGKQLDFPTMSIIYGAIRRHRERSSTEEDELLLRKFITIIKTAIAERRTLWIGY